MIFYTLPSAGLVGCIETKAFKARALTTPEGLTERCVSKNMFDRYHCIKPFENFGNTLRKVIFCIVLMAQKSMKDS